MNVDNKIFGNYVFFLLMKFFSAMPTNGSAHILGLFTNDVIIGLLQTLSNKPVQWALLHISGAQI